MRSEDQNLLKALLDGEFPDESGRFGVFGGQYAPETLMPALKKLEKNIKIFLKDKTFSRGVRERAQQLGWSSNRTDLCKATQQKVGELKFFSSERI
jgi:Tryptophan synthase beta chain